MSKHLEQHDPSSDDLLRALLQSYGDLPVPVHLLERLDRELIEAMQDVDSVSDHVPQSARDPALRSDKTLDGF